ncbi:MAG: NADH-quinone oxidoreductase subunit H [Gemmataceae bacterium]
MYFEFTEFHFWVTLVLIAALMGAVQGTCRCLILAEPQDLRLAQDRVGPNRVGREFGLPFGLLQPIADGLKFLLKEQVIPNHVDKAFYFLGPMIAVSTALLAIAVVPFGATTPAPELLDRRTPDMVELSSKPLGPRAALPSSRASGRSRHGRAAPSGRPRRRRRPTSSPPTPPGPRPTTRRRSRSG